MIRRALATLRARLLALTALWLCLALAGAWLVIGTVLERFVEARFRAELQATSDAILAGLAVDGATGELTLATPLLDPRFARPLSGWYWQVTNGDGDPIVSESLFLDTLVPPYLAGPDAQALVSRVRTATIPDADGPIDIVVAAPAAEIAAAAASVRRPLLWSLLALGAGLAALSLLQITLALSALARIGRGIAAVRAGSRERLNRTGMREVDAPVDEINALLDANRAVLTRTRDHVGNLAHALKTPLAALLNAAPPDSSEARTAERMNRLIGYHLRRARGAGAARLLGSRSPVLAVCEDIAMVLRGPASERGVTLGIECAEGLAFAGEREDLEEILGNLAENAVQWASSRVAIAAVGDGADDLVLHISDDGPGIPETNRAHVLTRGGRLDETAPGSGLGLGIVADLVALNGGTMAFGTASEGGLEVTIRLPRA